jgi:hypothetical protein
MQRAPSPGRTSKGALRWLKGAWIQCPATQRTSVHLCVRRLNLAVIGAGLELLVRVLGKYSQSSGLQHAGCPPWEKPWRRSVRAARLRSARVGEVTSHVIVADRPG